MSAGILLAMAVMLAFILRDVLVKNALPGLESRIFYSSEVYTRSVLASGQLPYWNPFYFSGTPHFADPENLVFYPPALALRWLPTTAFMQWMAILHVLVGAAGMVFLTRTVAAGWLGAFVAALAFVGGGTVTAWLHHGHVLLLYCAAWLPWALGYAIRSTARGGVLPHPGLIAVMVLQFLTGYLQGSMYIGAVIAAYFLFRVVSPDRNDPGSARLQPLAQFAVLTLVAAGLAAFQLWPTLRLATEAGRSAGIDYVAASQDAWRFDDLSSLFLPFHGLVETGHRYLGDRTAYVGWLPILMLPFAFTSRAARPIAAFFLLLAMVAVVIALGDHLRVYRLHYALFPGFRVPGRTLFVATVAFSLLGALGLEQFIALCRSREWKRMAVPVCIGLAWALVSIAVGLTFSPPGAVAPMRGWPWLPVVTVGTIAVAAMVSATGRVRLASSLCAACLVLDLGLFSADAVHAAPVPDGTYWSGLSTGGGRVLSTCWMDLGETLEGRLPALDGLANMYLRDYADWAYLVRTGEAPQSGALVTKIGGLDGTLPARRDLVDLSNATTIVSCTPLTVPALTERSRVRNERFVYRNDAARERAFWTCGLEEVSRADLMTRLVRARYSSDGNLVTTYPISVRWTAGLADETRTQIETRYRLGPGDVVEGTLRRYLIPDPDARLLLMLAADPAAEDTNGFDRATGHVPVIAPLTGVARGSDREWLLGARPCASQGTVSVVDRDRPDGGVIAEVDAPVDGDVYFNESHFGERLAFVDGVRVDVHKANVAFTAVSVPAGRHRVELRYVPTSFYRGVGISSLSLISWLAVSWRTRGSLNANRT